LGEVADAALSLGGRIEKGPPGGKPDPTALADFEQMRQALEAGAKATLRGFRPKGVSSDVGGDWIALFDPEDRFGHDLVAPLTRAGFRPEVVDDPASAHRYEEPPKAVVFQVDVDRAASQGEELAGLWPGAPTLALASGAGFADRLAAIRSGAKAVFPIPLDFGQLTAALGRWTRHRHSGNPYRVALVSGDPMVRTLLHKVLTSFGLQIVTVETAEGLLDPLRADPPDLALVDRYLPECDDLALAILADQAALSTPILSFSALGGDPIPFMGGFQRLALPVGLDLLATEVEQAAVRARAAAALQARDRLTGLLNRDHVLELLESEVDRATRHQEPLALAILDLDRFKQINGLYGSAVGDQVMMALTNLLRVRMRRSDLVGHFGGGSFAVVLPDTDIETARRVMEGVRERFVDQPHHSGRGSFHASFSCGIAPFPQNPTPAALEEAAKGALVVAKQRGRDQVLIA